MASSPKQMTEDYDREKPKLCPFCGEKATETETHEPLFVCENDKCPIRGVYFTPQEWANRPIEKTFVDGLNKIGFLYNNLTDKHDEPAGKPADRLLVKTGYRQHG